MHSPWWAAVYAIFIDFSRAFLSTALSIQNCSFHHFGITGNLFQWISAFVYAVSKCCGRVLQLSMAIPQRTVTGPVFFIIYIDDFGILNR